jgi:hypothetical protein
VAQFYMKKRVRTKSKDEIQRWIADFKKLDLRLVNWKLGLSPKWRNQRIITRDAKGRSIMDPNWTLAHVTHNTSVILLHQFIAYPPTQLFPEFVAVQQRGSASTCLSAASEISNVTKMYLSYNDGITNPQFAFCLLVSGRALLAHAAYNNSPLLTDFYTITKCLKEISVRFQGEYYSDKHTNIGTMFVSDLERYAEQVVRGVSKGLDIQKPAYNSHDPGQASEPEVRIGSDKNKSSIENSETGFLSFQQHDSLHSNISSRENFELPSAFFADVPYMDFINKFASPDGNMQSQKSKEQASFSYQDPAYAELISFFDDDEFQNLDRVLASSSRNS